MIPLRIPLWQSQEPPQQWRGENQPARTIPASPPRNDRIINIIYGDSELSGITHAIAKKKYQKCQEWARNREQEIWVNGSITGRQRGRRESVSTSQSRDLTLVFVFRKKLPVINLTWGWQFPGCFFRVLVLLAAVMTTKQCVVPRTCVTAARRCDFYGG